MKCADAMAFCDGDAYALPHRQNTWGLKKGFQALLERIPGYQIMYAGLEEKKARQKDSGWQPSRQEIKEGFAYVKQELKPYWDDNERLEWIVGETKSDDNPIAGWPMGLVKEAAANVGKVSDGADVNRFYPLTIFDLKPVFVNFIIPLIFALGLEKGLMLLGMPGVGKTPLAIILSMAFGRYHVHRLGLNRLPGWRRGKQFDVFRQKPGEIQEGILVDDATLSKIRIEDVMSFGDASK